MDKQPWSTDLFEIWRDIPGYEGDYLVSDLGRVWSFKHKKFLKSSNNGKGYRIVVLYKDGKPKCIGVHRLVAKAFVANARPETATEVNHIDHNRSNNRATNLEWVTRTENNRTRSNITKIAAYSPYTGERVGVWDCQVDAARELGIRAAGISACLRGKQKTAGGLEWARMED